MKKFLLILTFPLSLFAAVDSDDQAFKVYLNGGSGVDNGRLEDVIANYSGSRALVRAYMKAKIEAAADTNKAFKYHDLMLRAEAVGVTIEASKRNKIIASKMDLDGQSAFGVYYVKK